MATRQWAVTANGTFDFNNVANWQFGIVPDTIDIAQFNTGVTDTVTGNATIAEIQVTQGNIDLTGSYTITGAQPTEISVSTAGFDSLVIEQGASVVGNQAVSLSGQGATLEVAGTLVASSVSVGAGNLYIDTGSVFDVAGPITFADQGLLRGQPAANSSPGAPVAIASAIQTAGTNYLESYGKQELDLNGVISGSGLVEFVGDGQADTVAVNGNNTYTGGTLIAIPNLTVKAGNANAFGTGKLTITAGELLATTTETITNQLAMTPAFTIAAAHGQTLTLFDSWTFSPNASQAVTFGAAGQDGTVQLKINGVATINPGAYTVNVQAGTLQAADGGVSFLVDGAANVSVQAGASLDAAGFGGFALKGLSGGGLITNSGGANTLILASTSGTGFSGVINGAYSLDVTGAVTLTGINTYIGGTTIASGGALTLGNGGSTGSVPGSIADNGTLAIDQSGSVTLNNVSGTGALVQEGTGTTTLGSGISYSGGTTITNGTLVVGNAAALGAGAVTVNGGELLGTTTETISSPSSMTLEGNTTLAAAPGQTLTISPTALDFDANSITIGAAGQTGVVQFKIASTTTLTNPNAYTVTIAAGTLKVLDVDSFFLLGNDTSTTVQSGATLDLGGQSLSVNGLKGSGSVVDSGAAATLTVNGGDFGGTISGPIALTVGGTLILTGSNTYTGNTTINSGAQLALGNGGATGSVAGSITDSGTLAIDQSGSFALNNVSGAGNVLQEGTGTTILGSGLSYTGGTTVLAGTLSVGNPSALGTGPLTINGGELLASASETITSPSTVTIEGSSTIAAASGQTLTIDAGTLDFDANSITIGAAGQTGVVQFELKNNVTAVNPNAYSVTIQAGTLKVLDIASDILLGNDTSTTVQAGATLDVGGNAPLINVLQGGGSVTNSGAAVALTVQNGDFSGSISGPIALTVSGNLALTGTNTYTGGTTINSLADLTLGNNGSTGSIAGNIVDNGTLEFRLGGTTTESGIVSGTGKVVQDGSGITALTRTNSYSGGTFLGGGQLDLAGPGAAGGGAITFLNSIASTLQIDGTAMPSNQIVGFAQGDVIDLPNLVFNATSYSGGVLTLLENGLSVGQLNIANPFSNNVFAVSPDGSGGDEVVMGTTLVVPANTILSLSGGGDNVTLGSGDTLSLLGGSGYSITGTGDTIDAIANTSFNLTGANDTVSLGPGAYLGLIGGSGYSVTGTGDTIAATANTGVNLTGGNDTVMLATGDYLGLIGGSG
jgi:autotransporter-associated beta strand protein